MPTYTPLPSGKTRVQIRKKGIYRNATFETKREAKEWAVAIESQLNHISAGGFAPVPKVATLSDLIDKYVETVSKVNGRTKDSCLARLKKEMGKVKLTHLNAVILRDFIDRREKAGAGGVTIGADLSYLSAVLKWGRHSRRLDLPERLALDARASLKHRGLDTRGKERDREPLDVELERLYAHWRARPRQTIDMVTICKFALASGWRQAEICRQQVEDVNRAEKTAKIQDRKDPRNKQGNNQEVPLLPDAWAIIEPLIQGKESGPIFHANEKSVSVAFTRACQAVVPPIVDLHFHDLRHRATAQFFRMGLDIPRVALMTGHKTWSMLRRYTAIKPGDVHAVINKQL